MLGLWRLGLGLGLGLGLTIPSLSISSILILILISTLVWSFLTSSSKFAWSSTLLSILIGFDEET